MEAAGRFARPPEIGIDRGHCAVPFGVQPICLRRRRLEPGDLIVRERCLERQSGIIDVDLEQVCGLDAGRGGGERPVLVHHAGGDDRLPCRQKRIRDGRVEAVMNGQRAEQKDVGDRQPAAGDAGNHT
jgi:hypothetical protein